MVGPLTIEMGLWSKKFTTNRKKKKKKKKPNINKWKIQKKGL